MRLPSETRDRLAYLFGVTGLPIKDLPIPEMWRATEAPRWETPVMNGYGVDPQAHRRQTARL